MRFARRVRERRPEAGSCTCPHRDGCSTSPWRARLLGAEGLVLVAGRYEGVDERVIESEVDDELSVGDYVLSGGELPALMRDRCGHAAGAGCSG